MNKKELLQFLLNSYGKIQLTPAQTAECTGRSESMLAKDRMDCIGIRYKKIGKGPNAKVYYPISEIVDYLTTDLVVTK